MMIFMLLNVIVNQAEGGIKLLKTDFWDNGDHTGVIQITGQGCPVSYTPEEIVSRTMELISRIRVEAKPETQVKTPILRIVK